MTGNVTVARNFTQSGNATMTAPSFTFFVGGAFVITDGSFDANGGTVSFNGTGGQSLNSGQQALANLVHNGSGTLRLLDCDLLVTGNFTNSSGTFDGNGQAVTVWGLTTIADGTRYLGSSGNQYFGAFTNNGTLTLGIGGTFTVTGDYTQGSAATLEVVLGGPPAGGLFSRMSVGGMATLTGTLKVTLVNGYVPTTGDSFPIMTFASRSGDFTTGPAAFSRNYDDVGGSLTLVAN
jgi:hypothetical protein